MILKPKKCTTSHFKKKKKNLIQQPPNPLEPKREFCNQHSTQISQAARDLLGEYGSVQIKKIELILV